MRDVETGVEQTITTTLTHPFFVQTTRQVARASEGHVYAGPLADGYWIDAADLRAGDRLLNDDSSRAEVVSSRTLAQPLRAYNLTIKDFHTYFVAANKDAAPVWVHNICNWSPLPDFRLWRKGKLRQHFEKHGTDFGANSKEEYSRLAKEFAEQPLLGSNLIDFVDGAYVYRVDRATNTILVATRNGVLKTFYKWDGRAGDKVIETLRREGRW